MDISASNLHTHAQQITIAGKRLNYLDVGQGPVLLLGHSYLWDSQMWAPQIAFLSQHYRCVVPDLWGHGGSETLPDTCLTLQDIADHMLSLMDKLNIENFHVLGLSVGAMWGAELVLKAPARVQSLVMLDSFIGFEPEVTRAKYDLMLDTIQAAKHIPSHIIDAVVPLFFGVDTPVIKPQLVEDFKTSLANIDASRIDSLVNVGRMVFHRRDTMEEVEQFTLPCLIMVGVEDVARTVLESYLMHDAITGSQLVHIPKAGHISTLEQADFINQALSAFYAKHA